MILPSIDTSSFMIPSNFKIQIKYDQQEGHKTYRSMVIFLGYSSLRPKR